jgi:hypothetical protein
LQLSRLVIDSKAEECATCDIILPIGQFPPFLLHRSCWHCKILRATLYHCLVFGGRLNRAEICRTKPNRTKLHIISEPNKPNSTEPPLDRQLAYLTQRRSGWLSVLQRCLPLRWPGFDSRFWPDLRLRFCNPELGGTFSSTAIEIIKWVKKIAVPHLEAWVRVGRGVPHGKGHNSVQRLSYSKEKMRKTNNKPTYLKYKFNYY